MFKFDLFGLFGDNTPKNDIEDETFPKDYDDYQWYNPADWGGNYDSDLDDYNSRKKEELIKKNTYQIVFFSLIAILGLYVIKK